MVGHTQEAHTAEGAAVTNLILSIFRVNGRLLRAGDAMGRDLSLTAARWQVLGAIADRPRTVAQIARYFELTRQGVLWVVTALTKDSIVELIDNPEHKRAKLVRFTPRGEQIYREMLARQAGWANGLGAVFSLADIQAAARVLEQLHRALSD